MKHKKRKSKVQRVGPKKTEAIEKLLRTEGHKMFRRFPRSLFNDKESRALAEKIANL